MDLRVKQVFDKVYLDREHPSEFIDYISYSLNRELINKVIDKLNDHKLYIVQLQEPEFIEDLPGSWDNQCAYIQDLECVEVVSMQKLQNEFPVVSKVQR